MARTVAPECWRISPELRSAYVERFRGGPDVLTYYFTSRYLDPAVLVDQPGYVRISRPALLLRLVTRDVDWLEIPEPLWMGMAPFTALAVLAVRLRGLLRCRLTRIVTYAIENGRPELLLGCSGRVPRWIVRLALRCYLTFFLITVDDWVFGTDGARRTYSVAAGGGWHRLTDRHTTIAPLPEPCDCGDGAGDSEKVPGRVQFLGPLERRKGLLSLLAAWPQVQAQASLVVTGDGPLRGQVEQAVARLGRVTLQAGASRDDIHAGLRAAQVLVLLSQPDRRWREQIGLPVLEALAHGCRIVVSDETGISGWLAEHGHFVIPAGASPTQVAAAVNNALERGCFAPHELLPSINGRAAAEWHLMGGSRMHQDRHNGVGG